MCSLRLTLEPISIVMRPVNRCSKEVCGDTEVRSGLSLYMGDRDNLDLGYSPRTLVDAGLLGLQSYQISAVP